MDFTLDSRLLTLVNGPVYWFADAADSVQLIRDRVTADQQGVYCLWWKDPTALPRASRVELEAGRRGTRTAELKVYAHGLSEAAAMYVGKGAVRARLTSHLKPATQSGRNPYWWMTQIVKEMEGGVSMRTHLGFSFIEEPSGFEQIYTENLAIGLLRPWFNLRFTS
jgi:hypothetical protein